MARQRIPIVLALVAVIGLGGCTLATAPDSAQEDTRGELAGRLQAAQQSQEAALALWDRVIFAESVSCEEAIPVPPLVTLSKRARAAQPQAEAVAELLNEAIRALQASSDLWNIECADPRLAVPLSMAREGRANALAAGDPLREAQQLLAGWPPP